MNGKCNRDGWYRSVVAYSIETRRNAGFLLPKFQTKGGNPGVFQPGQVKGRVHAENALNGLFGGFSGIH